MSIIYKGVELDSRHSMDHKVDSMKQAIDRVPSEIVRYVSSIFCSSAAGSVFFVVVKPGELSEDLKYQVNASLNRGATQGSIFSIQNWHVELQTI